MINRGAATEPEPVLRPAVADDGPFLVEVLALAVGWRPGEALRSPEAVLEDAHLARYVRGWPLMHDVGWVAEVVRDDGTHGLVEPIGAAWSRLLPVDRPGYGFVAEDIPEVSVGVRPDFRGRGIGGALLQHLIADAFNNGVRALSLSVEVENPAARLYRRLGFVDVHRDGDACTLLHPLDG